MRTHFWLVVTLLVVGWWMQEANALRFSKPPIITEWTPTTFRQLNTALEDLWNITNGRYELDFDTTNPNGNRTGIQGELIVYDNSGSYKLCVNTDSSTTWRCSASALTTP